MNSFCFKRSLWFCFTRSLLQTIDQTIEQTIHQTTILLLNIRKTQRLFLKGLNLLLISPRTN